MPTRKGPKLNPSAPKPPKSPTFRGFLATNRTDPRTYSGPAEDGDPAIVATLESAIENCSQVAGRYDEDADDDEPREFCPAAIGRKNGDLRVLVFQFAGASKTGLGESGKPACWRVAKLRELEIQEGPWHPTPGDLAKSTCFDEGAIERTSDCTSDSQ